MVTPEILPNLHLYFGDMAKFTISEAELARKRGWRVVTILYEDFFKVRERIVNLGRAVEVLEPEALKLSVIDSAKQILDLYQVKLGV